MMGGRKGAVLAEIQASAPDFLPLAVEALVEAQRETIRKQRRTIDVLLRHALREREGGDDELPDQRA